MKTTLHQRQRAIAYYWANYEKCRRYRLKWRKANKEKENIRGKRYYRDHKADRLRYGYYWRRRKGFSVVKSLTDVLKEKENG